MKYFNVSLLGLQGRQHPIVSNISTSRQVNLVRPHIRMFLSDYITFNEKSITTGSNPDDCRLCLTDQPETDSPVTGQPETVCHLLSSCMALYEDRQRFLMEYSQKLLLTKNLLQLSEFTQTNEIFSQFVLDPRSMNLSRRVHMTDPVLPDIIKGWL